MMRGMFQTIRSQLDRLAGILRERGITGEEIVKECTRIILLTGLVEFAMFSGLFLGKTYWVGYFRLVPMVHLIYTVCLVALVRLKTPRTVLAIALPLTGVIYLFFIYLGSSHDRYYDHGIPIIGRFTEIMWPGL